MFSRKTVFVVGAGASHDLGFPTGDDLKARIVKILERKEDNFIFHHKHLGQTVRLLCDRDGGLSWTHHFEKYAEAALRIRNGLSLAISIDNYLHAHQNDELVQLLGKIAIATAILDAERDSALNFGKKTLVSGIDRHLTSEKMKLSWLLSMMRMLTSGRSVKDLSILFSNVSFVVFNYDRCIEQFD